jgi:hypothetical protein
MPEQVNKNWEVEVNAAVAKIGPVKGGELIIRTKNATKDLLGKLPQSGKVYLEQMMYAAYCSALRDDRTIKESEKAKLLKEYNREVRRTMIAPPISERKSPVKPPKNHVEGNTEPQTKIESPMANDAEKHTKSSNVSKMMKQETLLYFFENDFNTLFRPNSNYLMGVKCEGKEEEMVTIRRIAYEDFASQTVFVGFYIPVTPCTYALCAHLAGNYHIALELTKTPGRMEVSMTGLQPVNSSELKFSGRVFIYHESPLFEEQKRELFALYKSKGLAVQFRDWKYAAEKNESLTRR